MTGIIIVLGAPNDERGNLSDRAIGRLDQAVREYEARQGHKILCTGGYGPHFNTTDKPHAYYAVEYLIQQGIPKADILEIAQSQNTIEDALLSKPIVHKYGAKQLVIVTSDFHMKRARHIFERVFKGFRMDFSPAKTAFSEERYRILLRQEEEKLAVLREKQDPLI